MNDFYIKYQDITLNKFIIQNMFLINRETKSYKQNNINYFESYYIDGEPGSAGNWTKEDYDEIYDKFNNIFKKDS